MNNKFIIISEHRVGSRWMHYLFADLLGRRPSPEMDRDRLFKDGIDETYKFLKEGRIPKFHRATYWDIESAFGENNLRVLSVVRNPRDRAVSLAFHNRYHHNHHFKQKDFETDKEAVKYTVLSDEGYKKGNMRQLSLMIPKHYVWNKGKRLYPYVWVDYDMLLLKPKECIQSIVDNLELQIVNNIDKIIEVHSFKNKSRRNPGDESRKDLWRRKGVSKDWKNWFDDEMYDKSIDDVNCYNHLLDEYYWE